MPKLLDAVYEGNGVIRLAQEPEGFDEHQPVVVIVVPAPAKTTFQVEDVGLRGLRQFLADNEQRFGIDSRTFFNQFSSGNLGDDPDYILWAGAYEIYRRLALKNGDNRSGAP